MSNWLPGFLKRHDHLTGFHLARIVDLDYKQFPEKQKAHVKTTFQLFTGESGEPIIVSVLHAFGANKWISQYSGLYVEWLHAIAGRKACVELDLNALLEAIEDIDFIIQLEEKNGWTNLLLIQPHPDEGFNADCPPWCIQSKRLPVPEALLAPLDQEETDE